MLGRLRMSLEECEAAYIKLSEKIFQPKRWRYSAMKLLDTVSMKERYDSKVLERTIRKVIKDRTGNEHEMLKSQKEGCKV